MAGVVKGDRDPVGNLHLALVTDAEELVHRLDGVARGVEGFYRFFPLASPPFVDILGVFLLDIARILQHDAAEIARGVGAGDIPGKSKLDQLGDIPAVVDMSV